MIDPERVDQLLNLAAVSSNDVAGIDVEAWSESRQQNRLLAVLAYAQSVLTATDSDLTTNATAAELEAALSAMSENPADVAVNVDAYGDRLLDALARLPAARSHEVEQAAKDAAATFQRSAQQRLATLRGEFGGTRAELREVETQIHARKEELASTIEERRTEISTQIETLQTEFRQKLSEFSEQLDAERTAFSELRTSQTQTFESSLAEHSTSAQEGLEQFEARVAGALRSAEEEVSKRVAEIQRMESESADLVGAIGLAGTAERYGEEVTQQKRVADVWRRGTVILALLAVVGVIVAVAEKHPAAETFAGKLALSIILGGLATYAARQSSYHRKREHHARDLQLELTAFSPFIEPLASDQQEEERVIMTRKTFGKTTAAPTPGEEPGPTPLSFALRRKEKDPDSQK